MNRIEAGVCVVCGMPFTVERTDGVPLHGECEKMVRQKIKEGKLKGKKKGNKTFFSLKGMRYVPPS